MSTTSHIADAARRVVRDEYLREKAEKIAAQIQGVIADDTPDMSPADVREALTTAVLAGMEAAS